MGDLRWEAAAVKLAEEAAAAQVQSEEEAAATRVHLPKLSVSPKELVFEG
eukprot:COSAG01_NODE_3201_length_6427_cov_2.143963_1_plen_49_part_10